MPSPVHEGEETQTHRATHRERGRDEEEIETQKRPPYHVARWRAKVFLGWLLLLLLLLLRLLLLHLLLLLLNSRVWRSRAQWALQEVYTPRHKQRCTGRQVWIAGYNYPLYNLLLLPLSSSFPTFLSSCSLPRQRVSTSVVVSSCVDWLWVANASAATPKRKAKRRSYLQHQIFLLLRKAPNLCFFSNTPPHPRSKKERNKQAKQSADGCNSAIGWNLLDTLQSRRKWRKDATTIGSQETCQTLWDLSAKKILGFWSSTGSVITMMMNR